jgi:ferrous iron transport protein A
MAMPLGLLGAGEAGEITEIRTSKASSHGTRPGAKGSCECRVEDLGIRVGRIVEMLQNSSGPVLLKVGEARLAVDRSLAMKIMIKEVAR